MKYLFDQNGRLIGRTDNQNMTGLEISTDPPMFNSVHQDCKYIDNAWVLIDKDTTLLALKKLRIQRNQLLQQTDWRMTTDYPYNDQSAWASYRTELRDLPATASPALDENGQLTNVVWPTPPDAV